MTSKKKSTRSVSLSKPSHDASKPQKGQKRTRKQDSGQAKLPAATEQGSLPAVIKKQKVESGSRLKKSHVEKAKSPSLQSPNQSEKSEDMSESLQYIATATEELAQISIKERKIKRPSLHLLQEVAKVIRKTNPVKVLTSAPALPKVLLIAARKGVDTRDHFAATDALVDLLILFAKLEHEDLPDFQSNKNRRRSAFADDTYGNLSKIEVETVKRAAKWAVDLLSSCIRGATGTDDDSHGDKSDEVLQHSHLSDVFVASRDKLDVMISDLLSEHICTQLRNINFADISQHQIRGLCFATTKLHILLAHPACIQIVDEILLAAAKIYTTQFRASASTQANDIISFLGHEILESGAECFSNLSLSSQLALLRHNRGVWNIQRERVENSLCDGRLIAVSEEKEIGYPIAAAAAQDVSLHWELIDEVRAEVSRMSEPFSLCSWRRRRFYSVVFEETFFMTHNGISVDETTITSCESLTPLTRRFPASFRKLTKVLSYADKCLSISTPISEESVHAAVIYAHQLDGSLRMANGAYSSSPNMQAFLICVESILKRMCWACAKWTAEMSDSISTAGNGEKALPFMCTVTNTIDTYRLPGGASAETTEIVNRRIRMTETLIKESIKKKQIELPERADRVRINGMLAFILAGLICASDFKELPSSFKIMEEEELREIIHALQTVIQWMKPTASSKRCGNALKKAQRVYRTREKANMSNKGGP